MTLSAELQAGKPFRLTARAGEVSVRMEGETVQPAQKRPMEKRRSESSSHGRAEAASRRRKSICPSKEKFFFR